MLFDWFVAAFLVQLYLIPRLVSCRHSLSLATVRLNSLCMQLQKLLPLVVGFEAAKIKKIANYIISAR